MGNLNKVMLIGRLGQNPEIRTTTTGKAVVNLTLATSEYYKDQSGNRQERTEWHRVILWENTANIVNQYCRKGSQLFVEGSLQTRKWTDKDGNDRYTTEIVGRNIQLLDPKGTGQGQSQGNFSSGESANHHPPQRQSNYPNYPANDSMNVKKEPFNTSSGSDDEFVEDDIPF